MKLTHQNLIGKTARTRRDLPFLKQGTKGVFGHDGVSYTFLVDGRMWFVNEHDVLALLRFES